jgi:transcriptional regulator with XRE-family HTH domain
VATPKVLSHDIGEFIRDLRQNARISLRQLAEQAGVSNPYLSQIERGLRKPSAEVLQQLATALRVSTPMMYLRAGLLDLKDGQGVLAAIANDTDLTEVQKQTLTQIYDTFRRENARGADTGEPPPTPTSPVRSVRRPAKSVATDVPATEATATKATPQKTTPKKTTKVATATEKE